MSGTEGEIVLTRDLSSGRVHKRTRVGASLQSFEADNLDTAQDFEVITAIEFERVEPDALCRRCFGEPQVDGE